MRAVFPSSFCLLKNRYLAALHVAHVQIGTYLHAHKGLVTLMEALPGLDKLSLHPCQLQEELAGIAAKPVRGGRSRGQRCIVCILGQPETSIKMDLFLAGTE